MNLNMFRVLDGVEEKEFRNWARLNYIAGSDIKGIWHPVVQDECARINQGKKPIVFYVKFTAGVWKDELGTLENKTGDFYNVRPDKAPHLLLALKETEFEVV